MNKFLKDLVRANGLPRAILIAQSNVRGSDPSNWSSLPVGPVFYSKTRSGQLALETKRLTKTHNQWKDMLGVLKKVGKK